jgi:type IV pilus assembly protein PilY1
MNFKRLGLIVTSLYLGIGIGSTFAASLPIISLENMASVTNLPVSANQSAPPIVMLTISRDQQLHYKAYNDYSDLDGNGVLETTYAHNIDYYGYFDSYKCYNYTTTGFFEPTEVVNDKYCNTGTITGQWSGNFLNWAAMTRMDAIRKLLYGGLRSTDTAALTILERSALPTDAHSFAKYYNGSDIARLTPFTNLVTTPPSVNVVIPGSLTLSNGNKILTLNLPGIALGDQIRMMPDKNGDTQFNSTDDHFMIGRVTATGGTAPNFTATVLVENNSATGLNTTYTNRLWRISNLSRTGISFCNLTTNAGGGVNNLSQTNINPPLLRVARGNFELWGANERWQCYWREERNANNGNQAFYSGLNASRDNPQRTLHGLPSNGSTNGEYIVRVRACMSAALEGRERCKAYPTGNLKPIGLLQTYGDDDRIRFGLVTPSYRYNISGGVLRKNVGQMNDEINIATDGTFIFNANGIIRNINALRMYGYSYGDGTYLSGGDTGDDCNFQLTGLFLPGTNNPPSTERVQGRCASWGNPFGEAYVESLRYLANKSPTPAFDYTTLGNGDPMRRDLLLGMTTSPWQNPLTNDNYCANLNILAFNASSSSYDHDQMNVLSDMGGSPSVTAFTDIIGSDEGIHGKNWFIGRSNINDNSSNKDLCTAKGINNLSSVLGLCPESPALRGTYQIAGAAYYAGTNRIRTDLSAVPANDKSSLKVTTFGISLATNTPKIEINHPDGSGRKINIIPIYRLDLSSSGNGPFGGGAIVDYRVIEKDDINGRGKVYVNWEDSAQGGDFDQDVWGTISYQVTGNTITVVTDTIAEATANGQGFGYIISGTTKDGPHFHSGIRGFDYTDLNPVVVTRVGGGAAININPSGGCADCQLDDPATQVVYTLSTTPPAGNLEDPLYYAAKWGGFTDENNNNKPDLQSEWDKLKADGTPGMDGRPDTYLPVSNPSALEASLQSAFNQILAKTASGTAAAVVTGNQEGEGTIVQSLYESTFVDNNGKKASWVGTINSLWLDINGFLREDNGNAVLDQSNYASDPAIVIFNDPTDGVTKVKRFTSDPKTGTPTIAALSTISPVWSAQKRLTEVSNVIAQRPYNNISSMGRHILTFLDLNLNGKVETGELVPFTTASFGEGRFGILNIPATLDITLRNGRVNDLVSYIRGQDSTNYRNRTVDYYPNNVAETLRLGDVVNSTPTTVSAPRAEFGLLYRDATYQAFAKKYAKRRSMVYVGANDGMIHAFNSGFFDAQSRSIKLTGANGEAAHPLGGEMWGYIPFNLLSHLTWLSSTDYAHVNYMDGKPRVFDARIFPVDADHPFGWGTVMVVGMRFGGANLTLPTATNVTGFSSFSLGASTTLSTRSAYVLMDITNPEVAPKIMAEITEPSGRLGFTTSYPSLSVVSKTDNNASNLAAEGWYLVFGSGPTTLNTAVSGNNGAIFTYDLRTLNFVGANNISADLGTAAGASFMGDPVAVDWDDDFKVDNIYIGSVGGSNATPTGKLFRYDTNEAVPAASWSPPQVLIDPIQPMPHPVSVTRDEANRRWVMFGTGRLMSGNDKASNSRQAIYGVIDNPIFAAISPSALVNTTNALVAINGNVTGVTGLTPNTQNGLAARAVNQRGWRLDLNNSSPAERMTNRLTLNTGALLATPFTPNTSLCGAEGTSKLLSVFFRTGAPRADLPTLGTVVQNGEVYARRETENFRGSSSYAVVVTRGSLSRTSNLGGSQNFTSASGSLTVGMTLIQGGLGDLRQQEIALDTQGSAGEIDWRERRY